MRRFLLFIMLISATLPVSAQDLNGRVDVAYDRIQGVDPKVFEALKKSLNELLNNRKWTDDNFNPAERIDCNFFLNITEKMSDNGYKATLSIQSSRPVYNTSYSTATVNFQDRDVVFRYDESQPLTFSDQSVSGSDALNSNLTAVFAYYIYLIVGFDYDSFSPKGGSPYFKKAQNIVNNAPEEGKLITGWKASESNRNRYWLIDQILSPKFDKFRTFWYTYHRNGLDMMNQNEEEALKNIFSGLPTLAQLNNDNTASILMQFYFNSKSDEWANLLKQAPAQEKKTYIDQLVKMDMVNADKYKRAK